MYLTSTPSPTSPQGTLTPTPTPKVSCSCWSLTVDGNPDLGDVKKGQTLKFIARAYVPKAEPAYVKEMVYYLFKDGKQVAQSPAQSAIYIGDEVVGAREVKIYQTWWTYTVDNVSGAEGLYHLELGISCAWEQTLRVRGSFTKAQGPGYAQSQKTTSLFLKEKTTGGSLLEAIRNYLRTFTGFLSFSPRTIKLQSFPPKLPLPPTKGCTDLYFRVTQ